MTNVFAAGKYAFRSSTQNTLFLFICIWLTTVKISALLCKAPHWGQDLSLCHVHGSSADHYTTMLAKWYWQSDFKVNNFTVSLWIFSLLWKCQGYSHANNNMPQVSILSHMNSVHIVTVRFFWNHANIILQDILSIKFSNCYSVTWH